MGFPCGKGPGGEIGHAVAQIAGTY